MQNFFVFRDDFLEVVGIVEFVQIQPIREIFSLNINEHPNIWEHWEQNIVNKKNGDSFSPQPFQLLRNSYGSLRQPLLILPCALF